MASTTKRWGGSAAALVALSAFVVACGMSAADAAFGDGANAPSAGDSDAGFAGGGSGPAPSDLRPVDNAVILVHAAASESFRLCFGNELDRQPQPDATTMPEANVVGVEVGSAVRLGPLRGAPGKVYLFDEPLIRAFYPQFGGKGPTCSDLLASDTMSKLAVDLGTVDKNLSTGVHLLVVSGCPANTPTRTHTEAECGPGFDGSKSNLAVTEIALTGAKREGSAALPAQVVHLSRALQSALAGRTLKIAFGDVTASGALAPVVEDPKLLGAPQPAAPVPLAYPTNDEGVYAKFGFRVEAASAEGGAPEAMLSQSLADVQRLSSPNDLPSTYFAAASNYVLLLLGEPSPRLSDGGADDDPRRKLHFLAVPVIEPKPAADGGAEAGDAGGT